MMMDRVISNLLSNSIKYSEPDGSITITLAQSAKDIIVQVADTGNGIPEHYIPYLFDAFFKVSRESTGSGLGLAITKTIIEAHGGKIWVESSFRGRDHILFYCAPKRHQQAILRICSNRLK